MNKKERQAKLLDDILNNCPVSSVHTEDAKGLMEALGCTTKVRRGQTGRRRMGAHGRGQTPSGETTYNHPSLPEQFFTLETGGGGMLEARYLPYFFQNIKDIVAASPGSLDRAKQKFGTSHAESVVSGDAGNEGRCC